MLESFTEIDVNFIGENCPKLEHFAFSNITSFAPIVKLNQEILGNLKNLEIWSASDQHHVCPNVVKQLMLNSKLLTKLLFQGVSSLDDNLLSEIWAKNSMLDLTNVVFDQCHSITVEKLEFYPQIANPKF